MRKKEIKAQAVTARKRGNACPSDSFIAHTYAVPAQTAPPAMTHGKRRSSHTSRNSWFSFCTETVLSTAQIATETLLANVTPNTPSGFTSATLSRILKTMLMLLFNIGCFES